MSERMMRSVAGLEALEAEWSSLPFPDELGTGAEYARNMHQHPFDFYVRRLRQIGFRGEAVLDAGCGTGTWSFAMAVDSAEVHAVDRNQPRVETGRWIRERFGIDDVHFDDQDITQLTFDDAAFDAVFCYGVVISYLSLPAVLAEFRRVLRPGGLLYMCLNGLGWSMYLRDVRGRDSEKHAEMGRTGIYNTVCQARLADIRERLVQVDPSLVERWAQNSDDPRLFLAEAGDALALGRANPLLVAADVVLHECGEAYVRLLADDVVALINRTASDFSHSRAGRGYTPDEVDAACRTAGFAELRWGDEGSLAVGGATSAGSMYSGWFAGHRQVWEFTARASRTAATALPLASEPSTVPQAGWMLAEDPWARRPSVEKCELRHYPYPYRASIAISNDTDGMTPESLEALHDFVNGSGVTPLGDGLGLEMSDSFWIWCPDGYVGLFHNVPAERDAHVAPVTDRIVELAKSGFVDTLHGFGHWTKEWHIDRGSAQWALDKLSELGLHPSIYTNHGGRSEGGIPMKHNIGGPWAYYQEGDDPDSPSYCLDLLRDAGYRYYWTDALFDLDKFGDYRRFRNQRSLDRAVSEYDFRRFLTRRNPDPQGPALDAFPMETEAGINEIRRRVFNQLLIPLRAQDGSAIYGFKRFRGRLQPNSGNFALQVMHERLDELEENEGAVIVYQHFGVWRAIGTDKNHPSYRRTRADVLDVHGVEAFRELARRQESGRLLVTTTRRLLDYLWVRDNLVFQVRQEGDVHVIHLKRVQCPVEGAVKLRPAMLEGIAFYVPRSWGKVVIEVNKVPDVPPYERVPDPFTDERDVVHFGWSRLEYPRSDDGGRRGRRPFLQRVLRRSDSA